MADVTNPGVVNVANEAYDGLAVDVAASSLVNQPVSISPNNKIEMGGDKRPVTVEQPVIVGTSQNAGPVVPADASGNTRPIATDQDITVGPAQTAQTSVDGGTFSPQSPNTINTNQNTVVGQTYGTGVPANVFV
jgi:hypothetical protein